MKIIKLGIISFILFFLLFTLVSLFFPSHIRLSKAIDINTDKKKLFTLLSDTIGWKQWYPAADSIDLTKLSFNTTDSSVIAANKTGTRLMATSGWNIYNTSIPNTYTVQWYMDFYTGWLPWQKFSGLLLEGQFGPMMEKGLGNLKSALELK
ncbi:MAG: hypothetical protein RL115_733 [Bacteroidota bacterium]|jgi:hypothetical protein